MSGKRIRVEVSDRHGTVAEMPAGLHLQPRQRDQLAALADGLVRDLALVLGRGEGWFYSKTGEPDLRPEGYDGVALCGCGSAVTKLAEDRRYVRQARNEPPF